MIIETNRNVNSFPHIAAVNSEDGANILQVPALQAFENSISRGGAFINDFRIVRDQLAIQAAGGQVDYDKLVPIFKKAVSYHDGGKIAGAYSVFDSTAGLCSFCINMRKLAADYDIRRESDPTAPEIICKYCYDKAQEDGYRASNILPRHWINMIMLSRFDIPADYLKCFKFPKSDVVRFDSSGDVENQLHAENLVKIAYNYPEKHFAIYSKNVFAVNKAFDKYGKPANMRFVQSSYFIDIPGNRSKYADVVFTVYSGGNIAAAISGGACECNGKKCQACGFKCYLPENCGGWPEGGNIAELLRA